MDVVLDQDILSHVLQHLAHLLNVAMAQTAPAAVA
jgi:hypothetical protein